VFDSQGLLQIKLMCSGLHPYLNCDKKCPMDVYGWVGVIDADVSLVAI